MTSHVAAASASSRCASLLVIAACFLFPACMRRTIRVTSDPPGAAVTVNDTQVGRTPCEFDFTYYGTYDVLWTLDGYEPLRKPMPTRAPLYEYPPFDIPATAWPGGIETVRNWHVTLTPSQESAIGDDVEKRKAFEQSLVDRAKSVRGK